METDEMLEQTNETENVDTQTTEENVEGIELTDTSNAEETIDTEEPAEEKQEVKKTLRNLLKENPDYQEEFNKMVKNRLDRKDREYQKEISKYKDTDNVLRSTLKLQETDDVNTKVREYYESEGIKLPDRYEPGLSQKEVEALARVDAEEIIDDGYDAMEEEANRLASKKYENLNAREKAVFNILAEKLTEEKNRRDLLSIGAKEDILNDDNFKKFRKQFNSSASIKDIYNLYKKNQPKTKVESPGSMKNNKTDEVKDFYTFEESLKYDRKDFDKNPALFKAIEKSMTKW